MKGAPRRGVILGMSRRTVRCPRGKREVIHRKNGGTGYNGFKQRYNTSCETKRDRERSF